LKHGVKWLNAECSECHKLFSYPEGVRKPETCYNPECISNHGAKSQPRRRFFIGVKR
jgi:hypothetical protein